ncbi:MAG: hypothetical protein ABIU29_11035 [Chthoniobacterales bacterium]
MIYFFSGLTKCLGAGWWDGSNIWRALTSPSFDILPITLVAAWAPLLPAVGILVWLTEIIYPFLIWPKWSRRTILYGVVALHAAIGLVLGMYLFALIMVVLNLAAFGGAGIKSETGTTQPDIGGDISFRDGEGKI